MRFTRPDRDAERQSEAKERAEYRAKVLAALGSLKDPAVVAMLSSKKALKKVSTRDLDLMAAKHGKIVEKTA